MSLNIWQDTVFKWTHWLLKEVDNLERSPYCAYWGCYPHLIERGSHLRKKMPAMERLHWLQMSTIEHQRRQLLHAESPVPARGVSAIRPGSFFKKSVCFTPLIPSHILDGLCFEDTGPCGTLPTLVARRGAPLQQALHSWVVNET